MTYTTTIHDCGTIERDGTRFLKACLRVKDGEMLVAQRATEVNLALYPTEVQVRAQLAIVRDALVAEITDAAEIVDALDGTVLA